MDFAFNGVTIASCKCKEMQDERMPNNFESISHLRDVTTDIGIESPEKRCGKTTLLSLLNELANRAVAASNISPPAFFRVIEDLAPTLLIDEVDTFLKGNDQLKGILNAGYKKKTAFVLRAAPSQPSSEETEGETTTQPAVIKRYSCWCPKALAKIGAFPDTLADRCIIIRMQRKTSKEQCDRSRDLDPIALRGLGTRGIVKRYRLQQSRLHGHVSPSPVRDLSRLVTGHVTSWRCRKPL